MSYKPMFDPDDVTAEAPEIPPLPSREGDRHGVPVYVYNPEIKLALNVALATGRPLLVRGDPGCGKSTLARHAAYKLGWRYYPQMITSRTEARDLQWQFDSLRRLQDAQTRDPGHKLEPFRYIEPGVLWWALDPHSARFRGLKETDYPQDLPVLVDPAAPSVHERAIVLLDEIDKADPDVPNNLLGVLGSLQFTVSEMNKPVTGPAPLVFITTNGERDLPEAFLRRCVVLSISNPEWATLKLIAREHFPYKAHPWLTDDRLDVAYKRLCSISDEAEKRKIRAPSTAEFLDALRACDGLQVDDKDAYWDAITAATMWKADVSLPRRLEGAETRERI